MQWSSQLKILSLVNFSAIFYSIQLFVKLLPFYCYHYYFSGTINPTQLLEQSDLQIAKAKDEALSRKEILEKVEKWLAACQDECWLEEYNKVERFVIFFL